MKAIITTPGTAGSVRLGTIAEPSGTGMVTGADGKPATAVEVEVVEVGVCGTDLEIANDGYGAAPAGRDSLVLGHENLGRVAAAPDGAALAKGQLVVATVRRPCPERCPPCAAGQSDDCLTGNYTERGIKGRDGYMAERYVESSDYLIPLPPTLAKVGVLMEPSSIVEKGLIQAFTIQRGRMPWDPRQALVCGAGAVGLLAAIFLRLRDLEVSLVAKADPHSPAFKVAQAVGATLLDADQHPVSGLAKELGHIDLIFEATGSSTVAMEAIAATGANGVCCLSSVTAGMRTVTVDADSLNLDMVLGNKLVFGTVNANRRHFEAAARMLAAAARKWPGVVDQIVTRRVRVDQYADAFTRRPDDIKTVIDFSGG
ncbi:MAG TPA: glucose 1-dehydrogenase [Candidatus Dormibacteraeota bacterium]|nr:glucose 1-dehydrogenase [Candidatus Dormibacteraeota bacterium]